MRMDGHVVMRTTKVKIRKQCVIQNINVKQGKSEGFESCDRPSNLKLDSNRRFFSLCDREI